MPSSGYAAIVFVASEQPTTAKWNLIGSNDSAFNLGTGLEDNVIIARHLATNAVLANKLGLSNAIDATNGVKSYTNAGTAGGTFYYISLGGLKLFWGITASLACPGNSPTYAVNFPASFFSSIQSILLTTDGVSADSRSYTEVSSYTTSLVNIYGQNNYNASAAATFGVFVIGT